MIMTVAFAYTTVLSRRLHGPESVAMQITNLLADTSKTTSFAALVNRIDDPIDSGIAAYLENKYFRGIINVEKLTTHSLVTGIDQDNFIELVDTILVHPVRVEDAQIATSSPNTLLCNGPERSLRLEMIYTVADRFAVSST